MSLTASYKSEIQIPTAQLESVRANIRGTPSLEVLLLAMEKVRKECAGELTATYKDCAGREHPAIIGIRTPTMPNGLGVNMAPDGHLLFDFDAKGVSTPEAENLCRAVQRVYAHIAGLRALKNMGYNVSEQELIEPKGGRRVVITGMHP